MCIIQLQTLDTNNKQNEHCVETEYKLTYRFIPLINKKISLVCSNKKGIFLWIFEKVFFK